MKKILFFLVLVPFFWVVSIAHAGQYAGQKTYTDTSHVFGASCNVDALGVCKSVIPTAGPTAQCVIGNSSVTSVSNCNPDIVQFGDGTCRQLCDANVNYYGENFSATGCTMQSGVPTYTCQYYGGYCQELNVFRANMWVITSCPVPPSGPTLTVTLSPALRTINQGNSTTYTATFNTTDTGTFSPTATCPSGATCTFSPSSLTFSSNSNDDTQTITLNVSTISSIVVGTYGISANASLNGNTGSASAQLNVQAPPCTPPTTGTMVAPSSVWINSIFTISCDFGSSQDHIPAPYNCLYNSHSGSAALFTCYAPSTPQNIVYTCQADNSPGFTQFCTLPTPVNKTIAIVPPPPTLTLAASPTTGTSPLSTTLSWVPSGATSCTASASPSNASWSGSKSVSSSNQTISGLTTNTTFTLLCSNTGGTISRSVTVTPTTAYSLNVLPSRGGTVQSTDGYIACGATCIKTYTFNSNVTLNATPASSQWKFVGWSGDCSGNGSCALIINAAKTVQALFAPVLSDYREF